MSEQSSFKRRQRIASVLRAIILFTGLYQLLFAEHLFGVVTLLSLGAITLPAVFTRGRVKAFPLEFELILFIMVALQFVIGEALNFYDNVPYFDKFVHLMLPLFIGYIASMLAYTMVVTGNLKMAVVPGIIIIILITLGLGSIWEIVEYLSDKILHTYLQGSLTETPLVDTMNDLIADLVGGVFGALLALRFIRKESGDPQSRLTALTKEIAEDF